MKLGLVLMGGTMPSKSIIQFSVDEQGCVPSLLFDLRPNYGGGNADNAPLSALLHSVPPALQQATADPRLHQTPGHPQASLGQSLVVLLLLSPGFWCTRFCCAL